MQIGSGTARRFTVLAVFAIGVIIGIMGTEWVEHPPSSTVDYKITAIQLVQDFKKNDIAAGKKYNDRIVEASGIVDECKTDNLDRRIIKLKGCAQITSFENVKCIFSVASGNLVDAYKEGDQISVVGQCVGEGINVVITNCNLK